MDRGIDISNIQVGNNSSDSLLDLCGSLCCWSRPLLLDYCRDSLDPGLTGELLWMGYIFTSSLKEDNDRYAGPNQSMSWCVAGFRSGCGTRTRLTLNPL